MPSRTTFGKRQKEQKRQQRQREKAALRTQRKLDKPEAGGTDDIEELRRNAEAQAAMFGIESDLPQPDEESAFASDQED